MEYFATELEKVGEAIGEEMTRLDRALRAPLMPEKRAELLVRIEAWKRHQAMVDHAAEHIENTGSKLTKPDLQEHI